MDKIKSILKTHFGVDCAGPIKIHGGLSSANYRINTSGVPLFLKIYDNKRTQTEQWTKNINAYMPVLTYLNEKTALSGRITNPRKTQNGEYFYDDGEHTFLLFDYIDGSTAGVTMSRGQLLEAAEIFACLHSCGVDALMYSECPAENFEVPFCYALDPYLENDFSAVPQDIKAILQPCTGLLRSINEEVKDMSNKAKGKNYKSVICHTDAHGYNLMQGERLILVDWEGLKRAPAEADLFIFTKEEYWETFWGHYRSLRPEFCLDGEMLSFYILRRKIDDIWAFLDGLLYDEMPPDVRERDLALLSRCCETLGNMSFEL